MNVPEPQSAGAKAAGLIRLRWVAIAGQLVTIGVAAYGLGLPLGLGALGGVLAFEVALNLLAIRLASRPEARSSLSLGLFMVVDLFILTALLYLTGGPFNPFSFLYIVHIALAAVILEPRWTWSLGLLSIVCFGLLFIDHRPLPMGHGDGHGAGAFSWHVQGMWVAFAVAAVTITLFVGRLAGTLEQRNEQLDRAREKALRAEKFAALATLATGAAHELATPLSTIAVVSKDLEYEAARRADQSDLVDDARLIRDQVDRCRSILDQLAIDTGQTLGESEAEFELRAVVDEALEPLRGADDLEIDIDPALADARLVGPQRTIAHAVRALVKNASQAATTPAHVRLSVARGDAGICFEVVDDGEGIADDDLARVTEPFFTTKEPGEGMGLGLFLAKSVAETLGGSLQFDRVEPHGTRAALTLPLDAAERASQPPFETTAPEVA